MIIQSFPLIITDYPDNRNMGLAWEKVAESKFGLGSYKDLTDSFALGQTGSSWRFYGCHKS